MPRIASQPIDDVVKATSELEIDDSAVLMALCGPRNELLTLLEREARVEAGLRGHTIFLHGTADDVALAERFLAEAAALAKRGRVIGAGDIGRALHVLRAEPHVRLQDMFDDVVTVGSGRRPVGPRGLAQKRYVESIRAYDLTFGIGPAGTGKTYLAMACAVAALHERRVKRIVLTRPAVEAGEKLGFLPGDLAEKVNPYLRPLYDALNDMMDIDKAQGLIARGHIEVAPLAFMRGRTLNDSFVILDEAQNTTSEQMRMFLTRLGYNSKAVVTGDVTQVDLPEGRSSGLAEARGAARRDRGDRVLPLHRRRRRAPPARAEDRRRLRGAGREARVPSMTSPSGRQEVGEGRVDASAKDVLGRVVDVLSHDGRFANDLVTRPHPLLAMLVQGELAVLFAPAAVWDNGRELLKPFAISFAERPLCSSFSGARGIRISVTRCRAASPRSSRRSRAPTSSSSPPRARSSCSTPSAAPSGAGNGSRATATSSASSSTSPAR